MTEEKKATLVNEIEKETLAEGIQLSVEGEKKASGLAGAVEVERPGRTRKKSYIMDLRVHSPAALGYLSVGGIDNAPALVRLAKVKEIDVLGIADFYETSFASRVISAAQGSPLMVIPGVSLRCAVGDCDDVALTAIFSPATPTVQIDEILRTLEVPESAAGKREYVMKLPLSRIVEVVESIGGIVIPSQMDKTPHRMKVIAALVEQFGFRTFDVAYQDTSKYFKRTWPKEKFHIYSFSSAQALAQVGSRFAKIKLNELNFESMSALMARAGSAPRADALREGVEVTKV